MSRLDDSADIVTLAEQLGLGSPAKPAEAIVCSCLAEEAANIILQTRTLGMKQPFIGGMFGVFPRSKHTSNGSHSTCQCNHAARVLQQPKDDVDQSHYWHGFAAFGTRLELPPGDGLHGFVVEAQPETV